MFNPDLTPGSLGLGVYADLAREVEDLGHRFTMLTIGSQSAQPDRRGELRALAASPMWRTVGAAAAPLVRTRGLLPAAAGLATYLRRDGRSIDLLHVESAYPHGAAAALAIRASGVTTTTGISAWVPDDGVGIVVPPDDPRALGEALTTVIEGRWSPDPSRLAAFVRPFSPSAVASGVVAIYQSVLAEWPSGRGREPLAGSSP